MRFGIAHAHDLRRAQHSTFDAEAGGSPQNSGFARAEYPRASFVENCEVWLSRKP